MLLVLTQQVSTVTLRLQSLGLVLATLTNVNVLSAGQIVSTLFKVAYSRIVLHRIFHFN